MANFNANQESQFGLLPILKGERQYNIFDNSCVNVGLAIASWCFMIGASMATFAGFWTCLLGNPGRKHDFRAGNDLDAMSVKLKIRHRWIFRLYQFHGSQGEELYFGVCCNLHRRMGYCIVHHVRKIHLQYYGCICSRRQHELHLYHDYVHHLRVHYVSRSLERAGRY